jgi:hypothetical protein
MIREDFTPPLEQREFIMICGPKFYKEFMKALKEAAKYYKLEQKEKGRKKEKSGRS